MALKRINGIVRHFNTTELEIKPVSNGRWHVRYDRGEFIVVGGRKSGGGRNEWFCHNPEMYGDQWIPLHSMVAALEMGIAY